MVQEPFLQEKEVHPGLCQPCEGKPEEAGASVDAAPPPTMCQPSGTLVTMWGVCYHPHFTDEETGQRNWGPCCHPAGG